MVDLGTAANVVATLVGIISIGGAVKSVYNGAVRTGIEYIAMIPDVADAVDNLQDCVGEVKDDQEDIKEGMVALSRATASREVEVSPDEMADELGVEPGVDRFYPSDDRWHPVDDD